MKIAAMFAGVAALSPAELEQRHAELIQRVPIQRSYATDTALQATLLELGACAFCLKLNPHSRQQEGAR